MILIINGGSSSVKFALFSAGAEPQCRMKGSVQPGKGIDAILEHVAPNDITAVGHRLVHGGSKFVEPTRLTPEVIAELRELFFLDPTHLPGEIGLVEDVSRHLPNVPQFACFD